MFTLLALAMALLSTAVEAPDCIYHALGCTYIVWYHGDGTGEALVSYDQGATHYWYSGRVGTCPGLDDY